MTFCWNEKATVPALGWGWYNGASIRYVNNIIGNQYNTSMILVSLMSRHWSLINIILHETVVRPSEGVPLCYRT